MNDKYITVSQLTRYIKYKIDNDEHLNLIYLKGEISNFKAHTRGHYYFTIKDETSRINAIMFASSTRNLKFMPEDGMKIMVTGRISVYEATGGYQIYVDNMIEDGIGNLYVQYEQLKKKLEQEGLFDPKHKKEIPKIPTTVGIITAPTGAAIKDILSTIKRRWPNTKTILFPSLVQGASAAPEIVKQINKAQEYDLDVLIVGRGGGSIEDLWCFNDESVARAIYNCKTPTISAVGHEIDFTIADFVADLRAPTPTGAAEMAVANQTDFIKYLNQIKIRLNKSLSNLIGTQKERLESLKNSYIFKNPKTIYEIKEQKFDTIYEKLFLLMHSISENNRTKYNNTIISLNHNMDKVLLNNKNRFLSSLNKLEVLNPLLTIKRGYSIAKIDNKIVTSINDVKEKDKLEIKVTDGTIYSTVTKKEA